MSADGWHWRKCEGRVDRGYKELVSPDGAVAATVWLNGTWSTWDEGGTGGQNSREAKLGEAMRQAWASLWEQQWHGLVAPEGHPVTGAPNGR